MGANVGWWLLYFFLGVCVAIAAATTLFIVYMRGIEWGTASMKKVLDEHIAFWRNRHDELRAEIDAERQKRRLEQA